MGQHDLELSSCGKSCFLALTISTLTRNTVPWPDRGLLSHPGQLGPRPMHFSLPLSSLGHPKKLERQNPKSFRPKKLRFTRLQLFRPTQQPHKYPHNVFQNVKEA